jgi:hypothetical protein
MPCRWVFQGAQGRQLLLRSIIVTGELSQKPFALPEEPLGKKMTDIIIKNIVEKCVADVYVKTEKVMKLGWRPDGSFVFDRDRKVYIQRMVGCSSDLNQYKQSDIKGGN